MRNDQLERKGQKAPSPYEKGEEAKGHLDRIEEARTEKQVEAMVVLAKRFPRDVEKAKEEVLRFCRIPEFAEEALYRYPRGDKEVIGHSIRLAETIAQNWGNMLYGIQEVGRMVESSEVRAYCWELEKNVWAERVFTVPHLRYSKEKGNVPLWDPRDIYETVANQGARRLRAAVLSQIPADAKAEFLDTCIETLTKQAEGIGKERSRKKADVEAIAKAFASLKPPVSRLELENYLKVASLEDISPEQRTELQAIKNSLKDGFKKKADYFGGGEGRAEKESASQAKGEGLATGKSDPIVPDKEKSEEELRKTLIELMELQGKNKTWLGEFFGVAVSEVKIENIPHSFLLDAVEALRKMGGGQE